MTPKWHLVRVLHSETGADRWRLVRTADGWRMFPRSLGGLVAWRLGLAETRPARIFHWRS